VHTEDGSGTEPADYPRLMRILRDANYRGYVSLEYEGKEDAMHGVPKYLSKLRSAIIESWPKPARS
jgi:sugar phosphate isomerase/epimerase